MSGRLFDPDASRAVLIGTSRYSSLPPLRSVRRSLREMAAVLTDEGICRLPSRHCSVVQDPTDGNAVGRAVGKAAAEATDMLLVYYAGHGLGGLRRSQLFLALKETDPERPAFHSLAYDVLREEVLDSPAKNRVVILDCCFSGRAAAPIMAAETAALLEQLDIAGAYVLTASPANQPAVTGTKITEFTNELVQMLRHGVPNAPPLLTLDVIYAHLRARMKARNLPQPRRLHTDAAGRLALAPNPLHRTLMDDVHQSREVREVPLQGTEPNTSAPAVLLVNLARRSQYLMHRMLGELDRLERDTEDPDRLVELFELDLLASRMRRNNDNLLILADADSDVARQHTALHDVLRAAQSAIEQYARIKLDKIDPDIEIAAHAVNGVVCLIAELFENATAFSPPNCPVTVNARRLRSGVAIEIIDRGIGITPTQLAEINNRLAVPPDFRVAEHRMIGLLVVARLAARHRVKVELRTAAEGGTIADVLLPATAIIDQRRPSDRTPQTAGVATAPVHAARGRAQVPGQALNDATETLKDAR
ncbi:caspase, EACC1-associated type [Micromonospora sp. NPDC003197]